MKIRLLTVFLALGLILGLLTGCGSTPASSAPEAPVSQGDSAEASAGAGEVKDESAPELAASVPETENNGEEPTEPAEQGPFEAAHAENLPLADGAQLTFFVEFPGFLSMFNVNSYEDLEVWQYAEELLGIDMDFTLVNMESQQTTFSLMVASGDITDLVASGSQMYSSTEQMIEDGVAIDLMPYTDQLPNYWKALQYYSDYLPRAISQDGYMPEVITISDGSRVGVGLQIRQDWLDDMGAEIPSTFDELHDVLLSFTNNYGADHALLLTGSTQLLGSALVGGFGSIGFEGADATANMFVIDGEVKNGFLVDGYKEYMEMIAQWYSEGIIASDFAAEPNDPWTSNADRYITGGNTGVWTAQSDNMDANQIAGQDANPDYRISPMAQITKDGDPFHFTSTEAASNTMGKDISISSCCENVDLALAYLDFWFTDEGIKLGNYGIEGVSWDYNDEGKPELNDTVLHSDVFPMVSFACAYYTLACVATLSDFYRMDPAYTESNLAAMALWTETADDLYSLPATLELTYDENNQYSDIWSDISTYASTEVFKFVMGEYDFDADWDNFIGQLHSMGIDTCVDIYQAAYDRYLEAYEN